MFLLHLVEDFCFGCCWRNAIDQNIRRSQFFAKRFGQADQSGFRSGIMRGIGIAVFTGNGCDIDDAAIAFFLHFRHHSAAGQVRSDQIDFDHAPPHIGLQLPQRGIATGNPCIIDQNINLSVACDGSCCCLCHRCFRGQLDKIIRGMSRATQ